ncbi:MAG: RDD family protein [Planctomycetota bacterium]|nr:RDD family protein [Planctomycetota bacterium]
MTDTQQQQSPQGQWFYTIKGEQSGPVAESALIEMYNTNVLCDSDMVWSLSMKDWKPLGEVLPKIMRVIPAMTQPPQVPANPNINQVDSGGEYVLPSSPFDNPRTRDMQDNSRRAWRRFSARIIDFVFASFFTSFLWVYSLSEEAIQVVVSTPQNPPAFLLGAVLAVMGIVEVFAISRTGMTPGKWILRIRVVHSEGRFLTLTESLKRYLYVLVRGMGFMLFPLFAIFFVLSFVEVSQTGATLWDKRLSSEVQHGSMQGKHVAVASATGAFVALALLAIIGG